jgi:tetratricopeptide (TPR) repeat protein
VAWVAERKDVLCAFFWFLTLWVYVRYTERPSPARYAMLLLAFCLGLMAKPMVVTLPFVLLLLDVWPLRRLPFPMSAEGDGKPRTAIFREKAPLFALSLAVSIVTWLVQQRGGAVKALIAFPFSLRLENALVSYSVYLIQMFWPLRLAVFYPYPQHLPAWQASLAGLVLAVVSAMVVRLHRSRPYLATGWFWYLGTLIPVIGLVQVGTQAHADRYTYIPLVGLSIMLAWGLAEVARRPRATPYAAAVGVLACLACAALAWFQIQHWRNSETLFRHALDVTTENAVAHTNLGIYLMNVSGGSQEAVGHAFSHLEAALRIDPDSAPAHTELGRALARMPGRLPESFPQFQAALRLAPEWPVVHNELGNALLKAGRLPEAIVQFATAARLDPDFAGAHYNLAVALSQVPGRMADAVPEYHEALRIQPDFAEAQLNLGNALTSLPGRLPEAIRSYQAALRIRPNYAEAHYNLGRVLSSLPGAIAEYEAALRIRPDCAEAHNNLGNLLSQIPGRKADAITEYEAAVRIRPDYADGHYGLGVALSGIPGRLPEALAHLETAQRLKPNPDLRQAIDRLRTTRR